MIRTIVVLGTAGTEVGIKAVGMRIGKIGMDSS